MLLRDYPKIIRKAQEKMFEMSLRNRDEDTFEIVAQYLCENGFNPDLLTPDKISEFISESGY